MVVSLVLALAIPLPALAACGSALLESSSHRMCRMTMQSGHCEGQTGLAADCCAVDDQTARHQVAQAIAPAPGKPVLAPLPSTAQPDLDARSAGCAFWASPLDPPPNASPPRSVVLLI